jgi:hypothetical protein
MLAPRTWEEDRMKLAAVAVAAVLMALAGCSAFDDADHAASDQAGSSIDAPSDAPLAAPTADVWRPEPGTSWQWQLEELPVDVSLAVDVYDVDLFDTGADVVDELHEGGKHVICYISAGSWEEWRPDAADFPDGVLGNAYDGWEGERWLDIRKIDALAPIMRARLDLCRENGFDGVEPDNIDGFTNDTGFDLTYADQLRFNQWLADEAHARGLSIGLKNDSEQAGDLLGYFDWALTEDCFDEGWCGEMSAFVDSGRAVFAAEYTDTGMTLRAMCGEAELLGFDAILKNRDLDRFVEAC